ncbi:response regulator transcription factor [Brevibacterium jeotgali]|uniref:Two component transcriptional regulator, LuxR family n=1 Tax=Brevibacterium jeotgali TaxID=1262550 RepID=A0A2H1L328_9MICO|nr:response regulator transcription factor [Brevibacterium jeotgali]TWC02418.1 LuxR family two component transcriptional regulator [Brevibacterium jeotgali]SMY11210.1 two component transcriptional regulator, LuxR family [Brevibacterium jeotgali]
MADPEYPSAEDTALPAGTDTALPADTAHPEDSPSPIRVVLVDDQALVRAGFSMVIDSQSDLEVVGQAGDGEEAVALVARVQPDVVLMDVRMPRLDGIQAAGRILALADEGAIRTPRIIVLTTFDEDEYALAALRSGASGFLLKDVLPEILLDSIRTVVNGGAVIAPTTTRRLLDVHLGSRAAQADHARGLGRETLDIRADTGTTATDQGSTSNSPTSVDPASTPHTHETPPTHALRPPAAPALDPERTRMLASLTPREREVLGLVGRGMSNAEIVQALVLAEPTVKTHVGRILMKLGARDRVQAVVFAYDAGIVTPGQEPTSLQ